MWFIVVLFQVTGQQSLSSSTFGMFYQHLDYYYLNANITSVSNTEQHRNDQAKIKHTTKTISSKVFLLMPICYSRFIWTWQQQGKCELLPFHWLSELTTYMNTKRRKLLWHFFFGGALVRAKSSREGKPIKDTTCFVSLPDPNPHMEHTYKNLWASVLCAPYHTILSPFKTKSVPQNCSRGCWQSCYSTTLVTIMFWLISE